MDRNYWFRVVGANLLAIFIAPAHPHWVADLALHLVATAALLFLTSPAKGEAA